MQDANDKLVQPFIVLQHTDIAQYVIQNAPAFTRNFQSDNPRAFNPEPVPPPATRTPERKIPQNPFLTTFALAAEVSDKCFEDRQYVNAFFHNALTHFAFIFLDPQKSTLSQIRDMQRDLRAGKTAQVIFKLQRNHYKVLQTLEFMALMICVNPAAKRNIGGAVTYKKGTAEEALERVSNLFLNQLIYHASDSYQSKILKSLLAIFEKLLLTQKPLLQTQEDCYEHAEKWLPLIYKTDKNGYYISPHDIHEHPIIFFIDKNKLPSLAELGGMEDEGNFFGKKSLRNEFFTNCRIATVLDVVCKNNSWHNMTPNDDDDASFQQIMDQIEAKMKKYKTQYPLNLVMPLIGAGAYKNAPTEVCKPFNDFPSQLTAHGRITLLLQQDRILECIKLLEPASTQTQFHYSVPLSTIQFWWSNMKQNLCHPDLSFLQEFYLMIKVIELNQQAFPLEQVQEFCRQELHGIYNNYFEMNRDQKIEYVEKLCTALLGPEFSQNFTRWENLLQILDGCSNNHKENFFTQMYHGNRGLITAIQALKSRLYQNPPITSEAMEQHIEQVHSLIRQKHMIASTQTLTAPLTQTFNDLENQLGDLLTLKREGASPMGQF